jgi:hypothetical protein
VLQREPYYGNELALNQSMKLLCIITLSLFLLSSQNGYSSSIEAANNLVLSSYEKIEWNNQAPLLRPFKTAFTSAVIQNQAVKKMLLSAVYGRVINVFDHFFSKKNIPVNPLLSLKGNEGKRKIIIHKRITNLDQSLLKRSILNNYKEVLEFRVKTQKQIAHFQLQGESTHVNFSYSHINHKINQILDNFKKRNIPVQGIEIVHNHPVEAILFLDKNKKSLGHFYNPFSPQDYHLGDYFKKKFPQLEIEVAVLIGIKKVDRFKVVHKIEGAGLRISSL